MALKQNPFKGRTSEASASDQVFLNNFAPGILRELGVRVGSGSVHFITSPPGGGKTTILRLLTPGVLSALSRQTATNETIRETRNALLDLGVIGKDGEPTVIGVMLTCTSGYADLASFSEQGNDDGRFRALFNARVILRALSAVQKLCRLQGKEGLEEIEINSEEVEGYRHIPNHSNAKEMYEWAVELENSVFSVVDTLGPVGPEQGPAHSTLESVRWLSSVRFTIAGKKYDWHPVLLVDDLQWLTRAQRALLRHELINARLPLTVWMAERLIATDPNDLLAHGARPGRDYELHNIGEIWDKPRSQAFKKFVFSIIRRRIPPDDDATNGDFGSCLDAKIDDAQSERQLDEVHKELLREIRELAERNPRYSMWAEGKLDHSDATYNGVLTLQTELISIGREEANPQQSLEILPAEPEAFEKIPSDVEGAAELFLADKYSLPIYFGLDRVAVLSTNNVEEFLAICAQLYEGLLAKAIQRRNRQLTPREQDRIIRKWSETRYKNIDRTLALGQQVKTLLDGIAEYCQERTFLPNAPYAPGVTGVALTEDEFRRLTETGASETTVALRDVLAECIAENLLVVRNISQGYQNRKVLYLNRLLCVKYGLTYRYGGWQSVSLEILKEWQNGRRPQRKRRARKQ